MSRNVERKQRVQKVRSTAAPRKTRARATARPAADGDARSRLYRRFGLEPPRPPVESDAGAPGAAPVQPDPPAVDEAWVAAISEALENEPDATLARARAAMDRDMTEQELRLLIADVRATLTRPDVAGDWISERLAANIGPTKLPPEFKAGFDGWDDKIVIDPADCRYEEGRDRLGWVYNVGWRFVPWYTNLGKAKFSWHDAAQSGFRYPLKVGAKKRTQVSLLADWGTDLYHSKYIAKRVQARARDYVIHLGDVYYAGRKEEFERNLKPYLAPLLATSQVFCMNSNHEMLSSGEHYFAYLNEKRAKGQPQEGSYFCLHSDRFFIAAIDTAYHRDGRHQEKKLNEWLLQQLEEGRRRGALNILLSPNEPYTIGSPKLTKLFTEDLAPLFEKRLVDLWFWGNTHYCALYEPSARTPFIGSCIGHGGFPYERHREEQKSGSATGVRFLETEARFPGWTGVRQDQGNNGFVQMTLEHDTGVVQLEYIDWMNRPRHTARIARQAGQAVFVP